MIPHALYIYICTHNTDSIQYNIYTYIHAHIHAHIHTHITYTFTPKHLHTVSTNETSMETHQKLQAFGESVGKRAVSCKDTPGMYIHACMHTI